MLRSAHALYGYEIAGTDKHVGSVYDLLFDDRTWAIRYLVVDTGKWIPDRRVLVKPEKLGTPDWTKHVLPVAMTAEELRSAPGVGTAPPVGEQAEPSPDAPDRWAAYWPMSDSGIYPYPIPVIMPELEEAKETPHDPHLRSMHEVLGYKIATRDGSLGHVEDFVLDDGAWSIELVAVDTRNWLPGRKVLLPAPCVSGIDWAEAQVAVALDKAAVKAGPEYEADKPVDSELRDRLYAHYGVARKQDAQS